MFPFDSVSSHTNQNVQYIRKDAIVGVSRIGNDLTFKKLPLIHWHIMYIFFFIFCPYSCTPQIYQKFHWTSNILSYLGIWGYTWIEHCLYICNNTTNITNNNNNNNATIWCSTTDCYQRTNCVLKANTRPITTYEACDDAVHRNASVSIPCE